MFHFHRKFVAIQKKKLNSCGFRIVNFELCVLVSMCGLVYHIRMYVPLLCLYIAIKLTMNVWSFSFIRIRIYINQVISTYFFFIFRLWNLIGKCGWNSSIIEESFVWAFFFLVYFLAVNLSAVRIQFNLFQVRLYRG